MRQVDEAGGGNGEIEDGKHELDQRLRGSDKGGRELEMMEMRRDVASDRRFFGFLKSKLRFAESAPFSTRLIAATVVEQRASVAGFFLLQFSFHLWRERGSNENV